MTDDSPHYTSYNRRLRLRTCRTNNDTQPHMINTEQKISINDLPDTEFSSYSLSTFRQRLKTNLFSLSLSIRDIIRDQ